MEGSKVDIVKEMKQLAEYVKQSNTKIIPVKKLDKNETSNRNLARRLLLAFLLDDKEAQQVNPMISPRYMREVLERRALEQGYTFREVTENE